MTLILLTNDDGIEAEGLKTLEQAVQGLGEVLVVAPDRERSAVSHGLTLHQPLEPKEIDKGRIILNGTPADCVIYALEHLLENPPGLVISGINHGANLGDDIMYSGTVAAAREASRFGIPAIAISQAYKEKPVRFKTGSVFVRNLISTMLLKGFRGELCLNVNIPVGKIKGVRVTRQGCSENLPHFNVLDNQGDHQFQSPSLLGRRKTDIISDHQAIIEQYVSITPLQRDQTDYRAAHSLVREAPELFRDL